MSNITEKKEANLSTDVQDLSNWGAPEMSSNDLVIPMVLLMQYTSDKVKAQTAKFGELRDSLNDEVLGSQEKPFEIIPFLAERFWIEYDVSKGDKFGDKEYLGTVPITAANDNLPYLDEERKISRDRAIYVYGLIADRYDKSIPVVITFRRTSLKAGKAIMTQMYAQNRAAGKNPAGYVIQVTSKKEAGDAGDYAVAVTKVGRETKQEEQIKALEWLKVVKAGTARVDDSSMKEEYNPDDFVSDQF